MKAGGSSIEELTYWMKRETSDIQQHELNNFLVGVAVVKIGKGHSDVMVELKKVTKKNQSSIIT